MLFIFFKPIEFIFLLVKFKDKFKYLIKTINNIPIQNSIEAKPKIKKLKEVRVKSSILTPTIIVKTYKINQINSENNNNKKKF